MPGTVVFWGHMAQTETVPLPHLLVKSVWSVMRSRRFPIDLRNSVFRQIQFLMLKREPLKSGIKILTRICCPLFEACHFSRQNFKMEVNDHHKRKKMGNLFPQHFPCGNEHFYRKVFRILHRVPLSKTRLLLFWPTL